MDKSRQQFEAYFLNKPQNHIDPLKKDQFGYYYYLVTREAWGGMASIAREFGD